MKFIITIDTEADNQWAHNDVLTVENIAYLPRFQALCEQYHFKPTYLITHEVAAADVCRTILKPYQEAGLAEIGAHLHPWTSPPLMQLTENDMQAHPFAYEYPVDVLRQKLASLTAIITERVGVRPVTFRSGRYGFNETVAALLCELGYTADCSVTPFVSWQHISGNPNGRGGPDFTCAFPTAYFINALLEVPVSIVFPQGAAFTRLMHRLLKLFPDPHHLLLRSLFRCGCRPLWLRPSPQRTAVMLSRVYQVARQLQLDYIELILHSSELMPGGSKNTKDAAALERMYDSLAEFFAFLAEERIESVTLREYAAQFNHA
jgi:hypothetical protein